MSFDQPLPLALRRVADATRETSYAGDLWLVGGAVRDALLGLPLGGDFDLVTTHDAPEFARWLFEQGVSSIAPVIYERFGTAMVQVEGCDVELVTARRERYDANSRKPDVEPGTLLDDARRRDFTINTLLLNLHSLEVADPLGSGHADLNARVLRTPLDPAETFAEDPLRMLRAVRFRWKLGLTPADRLYDAIRASASRLQIISAERIREELMKMLGLPDADRALADLMDLNLLDQFAPEFRPMVGMTQGPYHHLDVWEHTLLALRNAGPGDHLVALAALFHDIGKPRTRTEEDGKIRFLRHEQVGADMARDIMGRLRFPLRDTQLVARLVRQHMRITQADRFSSIAARRFVRDIGEDVDRLFALMAADSAAHHPDAPRKNLGAIRRKVAAVREVTPPSVLDSPLDGREIGALLGIGPGPRIKEVKAWLTEQVLLGNLAVGDSLAARELTLRKFGPPASGE